MTASAQIGFYGKLPSRGDFLRAGLPRSFIDPWDAWWQAAIPASQASLGEAWVGAWMVAPIWRFALPAGQCGPDGMLGLWMPSIDRAGRHFPLTLARTTGAGQAAQPGWLDHAEAAGVAALEHDMPPDILAARLLDATPAPAAGPDLTPLAEGGALWWTLGASRVAPMVLRLDTLPAPSALAGMLHDGRAVR